MLKANYDVIGLCVCPGNLGFSLRTQQGSTAFASCSEL
jgi:hypothetical protein